jgi:hypothetical protein
MDLIDYLMSAEDADGSVLNNLIESQIRMGENENDDMKVFEKIVYGSNHERTYNALDRQISSRILEALNEGKANGKNCHKKIYVQILTSTFQSAELRKSSSVHIAMSCLR